MRVTVDERGLVISLASDAFFESASAELNIEETRDLLQRLTLLLSSDALSERSFRVEGHTDDIATDAGGEFASNWDLAAARSSGVLRYLVDYGVDESQFQLMSRGEFAPIVTNDTPEGRAYNRRVDVIILTAGTL